MPERARAKASGLTTKTDMKAVKVLLLIETVCVIFAVICVLEFKFMGESIAYEPPGVSDETPGTVITAKVRLDGQTLKIQERIYLKEPESELYLNIPAGIYAESELFGFYPSCRSETLNNGVSVKLCFDSETDVLGMDYALNLKQDNKILAYRGEKVYLTQFLITPAVVIGDKPVLSVHSEFGDPFVYDIQDYEIEITADKSYEIIAPGRVFECKGETLAAAVFKLERARDFPVVLIKNPQITEKKHGDILIKCVNTPYIHDIAAHALDYMQKRTGQGFPYEELYIVGADMNLDGMELSGMILISEKLFTNPRELIKIVYHEIFHQWFYGIVGTNQIDEPFIDEGLVCFLANDALGKSSGLNTDKLRFDASLRSFGSKAEYYRHVYSGGCAYFANLSKKLGGNFDRLLSRIVSEYNGKTMTYSGLQSEIRKIEESGSQ